MCISFCWTVNKESCTNLPFTNFHNLHHVGVVRGWRSLWVSVKIKVDETKVFTVSHISPAARSAQSASLVSENNKLFGINMTFVEDHVFFTKTRINYVCKKGLCHSAKCLVIICNFHLCFLLFSQLIKKYLYSSKILVRFKPQPSVEAGWSGVRAGSQWLPSVPSVCSPKLGDEPVTASPMADWWS